MLNIGIYIYEQAEVLDFSGPYEVFSTASRICGGERPFEVLLIGETGGPVTARGGYRVLADHGIAAHPALDVLLVSGGCHAEEMGKDGVIDWIARQATTARLVASVCTGAFLLAQARVLTTQKVTTHWEDIADLRAAFPALNVVAETRWIHDGKVVTSAGISAGIDMSLYLVGVLHSKELAVRTARQMEYAWSDAAC